jgi:hypothetical protein|nr:MAG TPA: hypothetical protein [Caudoviricetes sp.]
MNNRFLPTEIVINDNVYPINQKGDYGVILDVLEVLDDKELTEQEKAYVSLLIFYNFNIPKEQEEIQIAVNEMLKFINGGEEPEQQEKPNKRPLMNWVKDFPMLIAPINRVLGYDIREKECVHWWTIVSAYMEIGECMFQTVVNIRMKKQKGKKLDDWEKEFYQNNRQKVDAVNGYTDEEQELRERFLDDW